MAARRCRAWPDKGTDWPCVHWPLICLNSALLIILQITMFPPFCHFWFHPITSSKFLSSLDIVPVHPIMCQTPQVVWPLLLSHPDGCHPWPMGQSCKEQGGIMSPGRLFGSLWLLSHNNTRSDIRKPFCPLRLLWKLCLSKSINLYNPWILGAAALLIQQLWAWWWDQDPQKQCSNENGKGERSEKHNPNT